MIPTVMIRQMVTSLGKMETTSIQVQDIVISNKYVYSTFWKEHLKNYNCVPQKGRGSYQSISCFYCLLIQKDIRLFNGCYILACV